MAEQLAQYKVVSQNRWAAWTLQTVFDDEEVWNKEFSLLFDEKMARNLRAADRLTAERKAWRREHPFRFYARPVGAINLMHRAAFCFLVCGSSSRGCCLYCDDVVSIVN